TSQRFRINRPSVIHEVLDDELVIVNLKSGSYYSLDRVGATIWHELDAGASEGEILAVLQRDFDGEAAEVERTTAELLHELQREELILAAGSNGAVVPRQKPELAPAGIRAP